MTHSAQTKIAHAFLLTASKKAKHESFHAFLKKEDPISIGSRIDTSLSLKYFLVKTIISQQVSVKAAASIWLKVKNTLDNLSPQISIDLLREQGLSKPKASYVLGVMHNSELETLNIADLKKLSLDELSQLLLSLKGVGPWTLNIVRMFYVQDTDVFLEGDLGINKAVEHFFKSQNYTGQHYIPYRTYLCIYLWKSLNN